MKKLLLFIPLIILIIGCSKDNGEAHEALLLAKQNELAILEGQLKILKLEVEDLEKQLKTASGGRALAIRELLEKKRGEKDEVFLKVTKLKKEIKDLQAHAIVPAFPNIPKNHSV